MPDNNWTLISGSTPQDYTDTAVFEVDPDTKQIALITGQALVAGEKDSQYISFLMPRYWDGIDISDKSFNIEYALAGTYYGTSEAVNAEMTSEQVRFGWIVPETACAISGTLLFILKITSEGYTLKTQIAEHPVFKTIRVEDVVPEPTKEAWYREFQTRVDGAISEAETAVETAQTTLTQVEAAAQLAQTAAQDAQTAQETVASASQSAQTSAQVAQVSQEAAEAAAQTASEKATVAQGYAQNAEGARDDALAAQVAAETAQQGAEIAQTGAETAQTASQNARDDAQQALAQAQQAVTSAEAAAASAQIRYGSPLTAATAEEMTDENRVYVYVGSESGYTNGNWYYYDGTAWTSGGVYNGTAINTDTTLTQAGMAADAKATGEAVDELKSGLSDLNEYLVYTNNGNGLLSLGNIILTAGGNNTTTKAVRTNAYISDDIVKIIAKENKFALILCAYDGNNNNAYVGHSYGNGTDLISTNSEGTHVFSIDMREWRAAYPNYKWRLSAPSSPWREITLEEAYQYFSFAYLNIVSRDKFDEYKASVREAEANDVLANSLFVSMSANNEWYFETDDNLNIYVKAYPYLLVRGGQTAPDSYTIQWSDIVTNLSQYIVTSPKGVTNCLKLEGGKSLCLDIVGKTLVVKPISHQRYPYFADIIVNYNGRIIKGQIDAYIGWTNYKSITELQSKLADVAYVPDAMKTALTTINENATYNYPNMAKLLWISDVHWNNDCYAYLKYLADFGQYDALIISGDLNYYQFEQTLEATKTGMSELARLWNSYYRGKTIVLPIRGNHDGHVGYSDYTSEMFANAVIKPFHDCEDNGYYYYDLEKYRIRVVMLNSSDDAQSRKGFKSEEVAWFSSVINSVESGWNVISVSHHPIVEQLNTDSSLAGNSSGIVSAINSFVANKQDCRYIAHLSGHTHRDMMDKISGVNYVSIIDSSTDQSDYSADIICINQTTQTVNLLRSGEGQNRSFTY